MKLSDWIGLLSLAIALGILWEFREILLLVFMAVVLAIALNNLVRWLQTRWRLRRSLAVISALLMVVLGLLIVAVVVFPPFIDQINELVTDRLPRGREALQTFSQNVQDPVWLQQQGEKFPILKTEQVEEAIQQVQLPDLGSVANEIGGIVQGVFGNFLTFFSTTAAIALQILLVVILTLMMLGDPTAYRNLLLRLFPSFYRRRAHEILTKCEQILLGWMGGVLLSSIFVAIACAIGLWFLRIDLVFAHALLAGLFNVIPNIGPTLSIVFPLSVALIDSPVKVVGVVGLYFLVQNLESYWFSPMVMRQQVSLLPAATLVAQLFFATFLGPLGLVLALPLTVVSKVWIEEAFIRDGLDRWGDLGSRSEREWIQPGSQPIQSQPIQPLTPLTVPTIFPGAESGELPQMPQHPSEESVDQMLEAWLEPPSSDSLSESLSESLSDPSLEPPSLRSESSDSLSARSDVPSGESIESAKSAESAESAESINPVKPLFSQFPSSESPIPPWMPDPSASLPPLPDEED